jgi:transposase
MSVVLDRLVGWLRHLLAHRRDTYLSVLFPYSRAAALDHHERRRQEESRNRLFLIEQELERLTQQIHQRGRE